MLNNSKLCKADTLDNIFSVNLDSFTDQNIHTLKAKVCDLANGVDNTNVEYIWKNFYFYKKNPMATFENKCEKLLTKLYSSAVENSKIFHGVKLVLMVLLDLCRTMEQHGYEGRVHT